MEPFRFSVSATTRTPRPGEIDGKDYLFVTKERFEEMIEKGELIEHATFNNNYYGTPKAPLEKMIEEDPAWSSLEAVKNGRVHMMDRHLFNLKPNSRWGESYERLVEILLSDTVED